MKADFGKIDILVHSLANGPEVTKPLLETSRKVRGAERRAGGRQRGRQARSQQKWPPGFLQGGSSESRTAAAVSLTLSSSSSSSPPYV